MGNEMAIRETARRSSREIGVVMVVVSGAFCKVAAYLNVQLTSAACFCL